MIKMTRTAVFPKIIYDPNLEYKNLFFFNLEKYNRIYEKISKVTYQMTKTGSKE